MDGKPGGRVEARLKELGLELSSPAKPAGAYVPCKRVGNLVYVSGQVPLSGGKALATGPVPSVVSVEKAQECARQCVLNALSAIRAEVGSLDQVRQVVRVGVFVCSDDGFTDQPKVGNGASELLVAIFGEAGRHARAAIGTNALPLGVPVEVEFLVEVEG